MSGVYEKRTWASRLGDQDPIAIEVFIPSRIADVDRGLPFAVAEACTRASTELADLRAHRHLAALAPMLLREEGIASSRIEGLFLSTRRIYEFMHAPDAVDDSIADQVLANIATLTSVLESAQGSLSAADIRAWHGRLMEAIGERVRPGDWRAEQNWIGGSAWSPTNAVFIPPPPEAVADLMDDLVVFCNREDLPAVAQAAIAHAQFETIHPFVDGNGRVGRALIYWVLAHRESIGETAPAISPVFAADPDRYVGGLMAYRTGDGNEWILQFADAIAGAADATRAFGGRLRELQNKWVAALGEMRSDAVALRILSGMPDHPIIDPPSAGARYGVSLQAARTALVQLADAGILTEQPLRKAKRGRPARVFAARDIFTLLDRFETG